MLQLRMGFFEGRNCAHTLIPDLGTWGASAVTVHGRTRQQRYSKVADWNYINQCVSQGPGDIQLIGNGDVFSYTEFNEHLQDGGLKLSTCMIARGALIKVWVPNTNFLKGGVLCNFNINIIPSCAYFYYYIIYV